MLFNARFVVIEKVSEDLSEVTRDLSNDVMRGR